MRDENKYEGQGLRAPIWTVAGIEILKTVLGGGMGALCGGGNAAAAAAGGMAAVAEIAHKDAKIAQLQAEIATNAKIGEVYALLRARDQEQDKKMAELEKKAAVADVVLAQQTALLGQLTKTHPGIQHLSRGDAALQHVDGPGGRDVSGYRRITPRCGGCGNIVRPRPPH